jgi:hypothetical protein
MESGVSKKLAWPCKLEDDGVHPCHALDDCLELGGVGTRYQGVKIQTLINMDSGKFSRHLITLKSGKHSKKGLVFNLCPFCGEELVAGVKATLAEKASSQISSNQSK